MERKKEPSLLGVAADMRLAEKEVFNAGQLAHIRHQREIAARIAEFPLDGPSVTINLRTSQVVGAKDVSAIHQQRCDHCGGMFVKLAMHHARVREAEERARQKAAGG